MKKFLILLALIALVQVGCKTDKPNSNPNLDIRLDIRPPLMNTNDFINFEPFEMPDNVTNNYLESYLMVCSSSGSVFRIKNSIN